MFDTLYSQIGTTIAVVVVAFAFLKGDEPERLGAGAYAVSLQASLLLHDENRLYGPQWSLMTVDVFMLVLYAALAWKCRRAWPLWVSALQSLIVMSHLLTFVDVRPPMAAFIGVINLANYGIMLALAVGTYGAWRDRRADG